MSINAYVSDRVVPLVDTRVVNLDELISCCELVIPQVKSGTLKNFATDPTRFAAKIWKFKS